MHIGKVTFKRTVVKWLGLTISEDWYSIGSELYLHLHWHIGFSTFRWHADLWRQHRPKTLRFGYLVFNRVSNRLAHTTSSSEEYPATEPVPLRLNGA